MNVCKDVGKEVKNVRGEFENAHIHNDLSHVITAPEDAKESDGDNVFLQNSRYTVK